ncbi:unnamed protein product [Rhizophagus irregularis]|nr:unnamed protein product [Rhizophagus irregularis]
MPINCRNDNKFKWSERLDRTRRRNKTATSLHVNGTADFIYRQSIILFLLSVFNENLPSYRAKISNSGFDKIFGIHLQGEIWTNFV